MNEALKLSPFAPQAGDGMNPGELLQTMENAVFTTFNFIGDNLTPLLAGAPVVGIIAFLWLMWGDSNKTLTRL